MYAMIQTGGKQYCVAVGQSIQVEKLAAAPGESVVLEDVRLIGKEDGSVMTDKNTLARCSVQAEVVAQKRGPKITIIKFKRRQDYRRKQGHRQSLTTLTIKAIDAA